MSAALDKDYFDNDYHMLPLVMADGFLIVSYLPNWCVTLVMPCSFACGGGWILVVSQLLLLWYYRWPICLSWTSTFLRLSATALVLVACAVIFHFDDGCNHNWEGSLLPVVLHLSPLVCLLPCIVPSPLSGCIVWWASAVSAPLCPLKKTRSACWTLP